MTRPLALDLFCGAAGEPISFLSVCSGLEGASLAAEPLGWSPAGFAEIEAFPSAIIAERYGSNMPGESLSHNAPPNFGDFTTIEPKALGRVDVLMGGTPCQAFSIAGKRLSLADARGNLTLAYAVLAHELVRFCGLKNAFWENVPGVLSAEDNAFGCFLGVLVGADAPLLPSPRPPRGRSNDLWRWREAGRWPVLDDEGNETGEFVEREEGHVPRWPRSGMVAGPRARAAWRVLDAQYFRVPQRRERVFLIVDFGNGADPVKVLFEPKGVRGNTPPRRETGQGVAATIAARTRGGGGLGTDFDCDGGLIAFGGNNQSGPIDVATAVNAHGGPHGRLDFESETFVAHALRAEGFDASEDGTGRGTPIVPVAYQTSGNCGAWETGEITGALDTNTDPNSHVLAYDLRGREGGAQFEGPHDTANIRAANGGSSRSYVAERWAVRRLTPTECERLQGVPDGYTAIPWRGKPASEAPDGPRYKALGNSWAVPVVRWILTRLDAELRAMRSEAA